VANNGNNVTLLTYYSELEGHHLSICIYIYMYVYMYVNFTAQRCPKKIIKTLIEEFLYLPPDDTGGVH
jgi:hypothetical protein